MKSSDKGLFERLHAAVKATIKDKFPAEDDADLPNWDDIAPLLKSKFSLDKVEMILLSEELDLGDPLPEIDETARVVVELVLEEKGYNFEDEEVVDDDDDKEEAEEGSVTVKRKKSSDEEDEEYTYEVEYLNCEEAGEYLYKAGIAVECYDGYLEHNPPYNDKGYTIDELERIESKLRRFGGAATSKKRRTS